MRLRRQLCFVLLSLSAFIFEAKLSINGVWPDFTAMLAYGFGMNYGPSAGAIAGAATGLVSDGLSSGMLGPNLISKTMVGYFAGFFSIAFFRWTPVVGIFGAVGFTVLDRAVSYITLTALGQMPMNPTGAITFMLWQALINSIIGAFIKGKGND